MSESDLVGKGGHIRTVPIPQWVKQELDSWTSAAGIVRGRIFRAVSRNGSTWGTGVSPNVIWAVVRDICKSRGMDNVAPQRYLGCKQNLGSPVNDRFAPG